jgi:probable HAF family extracellular repeat protein
MRSRVRAGGIAALVGLLVLGAALLGGASSAQASHAKRVYAVSTLDSLGGTYALGSSINNADWVAGLSTVASGDTHAGLWRFGSVADLGTFGGPGTNSAVLWPVKNEQGVISGIAETDDFNPLGEIWSCGYFFTLSTHTCSGFVWQNGQKRALPTLGGYNSFATGTNNHGQTVGWAETSTPDPTCTETQVLGFLAVIWGPGEDDIQPLPPLPGDHATAATAINDKGQVVGISGDCDRAFGRFTAKHNVLWEKGVPVNIGDLGGVAWNTPMAINRKGEVVGFSNTSAAAGAAFQAHAFLSTKPGKIEDLGTLGDDPYSQALGINENRQVVGVSYSASFRCRAFLWEHGVMIDLQEQASGYSNRLCSANDINDLGQITGEAVTATGAHVPFLANPVGPSSNNRLVPSAAPQAAPKVSWAALERTLARSGIRKEDLTR